MSLPKPIRVQFDQTDRQLLKEVICEYNGGAFLKVLKSTAVNKNFEKMEVWNAITAVFNQVSSKSASKPQVRSLWNRMHTETKKKHDSRMSKEERLFMKSCQQTGGGPGRKPPEVEDGDYLLDQWITNLDPRRTSLSTVTSSSGKELLLGSCDPISQDQDSTGVEEPNSGASYNPGFSQQHSRQTRDIVEPFRQQVIQGNSVIRGTFQQQQNSDTSNRLGILRQQSNSGSNNQVGPFRQQINISSNQLGPLRQQVSHGATNSLGPFQRQTNSATMNNLENSQRQINSSTTNSLEPFRQQDNSGNGASSHLGSSTPHLSRITDGRSKIPATVTSGGRAYIFLSENHYHTLE